MLFYGVVVMSVHGQGFIDKLIIEHRAIQRLFDEVLYGGFDSAECLARFTQAKSLVIEHLKTEDELLYPVLMSSGFAGLAKDYSDEMRSISVQAINFFQAVDIDAFDCDVFQFSQSLGQVVGVLGLRIYREEYWLYPAYLNHVFGEVD